MNRRKAIKDISMGLSGGYLLPSLLSACSKDDPTPEIVYAGRVAIIGAGAAGLYAADILRTKGVNVDIYEAREQIGGRVRSLRNQLTELPADAPPTTVIYPNAPKMSSEFPLELGAQTIVGSDSIFGKFYKAYNLPTTEFDPTASYYVMDSISKNANDWNLDSGYSADFAAANAFLAGLGGHVGSTQTVQQEIVGAGLSSRTYGMLNAMIGNKYGGHNSTLGMGAISQQVGLQPTDGKIIALTSNPMQDALISRFSEVQSMVKLNTPIKSIKYGADPIILTAKDGTEFQANLVIVTVPISVIKNGGLAFSPGLPGTITGSLAKLDMAPCIRLILEFKKNFWGTSGPYVWGSENVPEYFSAGQNRGQFNATLCVTVYGQKATDLSNLSSDEARIDAVLADFDAIYAGQATQFIRIDPDTLKRIYVVDDWTNREHILGGISFPLAGATEDDRVNIGKAVNDKLFFAGEATDVTGQAGTVNGALASAERAVQEVVTVIKAL